jgi:glycosyltransferase involved in cell wall biosynthesis
MTPLRRQRLRILHLASSNRWTGAAAPAFAEVEALRLAGVEAFYAYVGGYKLEKKLEGIEWALPLIEKKQDPLSMKRSVRAVSDFARRERIDVIHSHLTYDHGLSRFARPSGTLLFRTFHSQRTLRRDPLTRLLLAATAGVCVVNATFRSAPLLAGRSVTFTPPPLKEQQFHPSPDNARQLYGLSAEDFVIGAIGKLAAGRGFEEVLRTFAYVRLSLPAARLMIIGHGEHRPNLERLASELGLHDIVWAGYHEDDLAHHLRAFDLMLFTAAGSDEGHRAVQEAMGCGVPVASFPLPGIRELLGETADGLVADSQDVRDLARVVVAARAENLSSLRTKVAAQSHQFAYDYAAVRLERAYAAALSSRP